VVPAVGGATRWMDLGENARLLIARVDWLPAGKGLAIQRLDRIQNRLDLMCDPPPAPRRCCCANKILLG